MDLNPKDAINSIHTIELSCLIYLFKNSIHLKII